MKYNELQKMFSLEVKSLLAELFETNRKSEELAKEIREKIMPLKDKINEGRVFNILDGDIEDIASFNKTNMLIANNYITPNTKKVGR